jgi:hypothetical protein
MIWLRFPQRSITALAAVVVGGNTLRYSAGCFPVVPRVDGLDQILDARFSGGRATLAFSEIWRPVAVSVAIPSLCSFRSNLEWPQLWDTAVHVVRMACTTCPSKPRSLEYSSCTLHLPEVWIAGGATTARCWASETCSDTKSSGSVPTYRASKTTALMYAADKEGRSQLYRKSYSARELFLMPGCHGSM